MIVFQPNFFTMNMKARGLIASYIQTINQAAREIMGPRLTFPEVLLQSR